MSRVYRNWLLLTFAACALVFASSATAQVAGQNVNMVSGTSWPGGDPFLQRQNEPSMAVSTRNPMHLLAGANDYRTVDLETVLSGGEETGDSWLGLFKSFDGGLTWKSTLLPGCRYADPQCVDNGALHGGHGYDAGSDPVVRAGTNGMFYYAGLAFDRATSPTTASGTSSIFVARYNDLNNNENADPITYLDTHIVAMGNNSEFLDKPSLAVDIPRSGATTCSFTAQEPGVGTNGGALSVHQSFAAGNVYMSYTDFLAGTKANSTPTHLMFTRSTDCGVTWSAPVQINSGTTTSQGSAIAVNALNGNVYVTWRQFASTGIPDAMMIAVSTNAGRTFGAPVRISTFTPFDQGTTNTSIRTNAYPSITTDNFGFVYVAFSAKGMVASGDARVVAAGSLDGTHWTPPIMVDNPSTNAQTNPSGRGHQIMPAISFANGRLTILYYDLRLDHYENVYASAPKTPTGYTSALTPEGELPATPSKVFTPFIDDLGLTLRRHTLDLRVLQLGIFPTITLGPSVLVSQYAFGCCVNPNLPSVEQFKFNVPNLPIFSQGEVPFLGDYIDVVPSPAFVPSGTSWAYNFTPSVNPQFHATWTDNRDVVPPANGDWTHYTPPVPANTRSVFDTGATLPSCVAGQEGMRNQNIYTAQITGGLIAGAKGNSKPLGNTTFNGGSVPFQRAFAVEAQNVTSQPLNVRFSIASQPAGGRASFLQFSQLITLDVTIPAFSSVSRSVFVTSTNAQASVTVNVVQIASIGGSPTTNGLSQATVLNPDVTNPNITNPNVTNPNITNPNITNFEVTNPNVTNPNITNPNVTNPNITNPNITNPNITNPNVTNPNVTNVSATNPNITNPNITNPNVTNPNITNPNITNPNITNGSIQDVIYPITNNGNTTATYTVKVATAQAPPNGVLLQLILNKLYQTPVATNCQLTNETHWVTVANITNPKLYAANDPLLGNPNITNATPNEASVTLAPGETAYIDLRVFSPTKMPVNPLAYFVPVTIPQAVNTQTALANPNGGTAALPPVTVPPLLITTAALPDNVLTSAYSATVAVQGGNPGATHTFSVSSGTLPNGLTLNAATGTISGTPAAGGTFTFSIQAKDAAIGTQFPQHTTTQAFTIHVVSPLAVSAAGLPGGTQGTPYSASISPVGGQPPFTISLFTGSLPTGLNFSNGAITGTPTGTGLSNFTVKITDSTNPPQSITPAYSINIVSSAPVPGNVTFVAQPANSTGGQVLGGSPITVRVTDNTSAVIAGAHVVMSFNGTPPCSTATLSGTLNQTTGATGIATFPDLSVDHGQLGYTLRATVVGAPVFGNSNAFNVSGFCDTGSMITARRNQLVIALPNGKILVAGGLANANGTGALASAEIYDPVLHTFSATGPMTAPRFDQTLTLLPNGKVLVAGGYTNTNPVPTVLSSAELFDPGSNTFTLITAPMTTTRSDHTATSLANGTVLIAGGIDINGNALATAEIYDPASNTFTATPHNMNSVRQIHHADLLPSGRVLISGGYDTNNNELISAEIYDPVAGAFTPTGNMNFARGNHASALLYTGKVLVAGGTTAGVRTATAELYDPSTGTFTTTASMSVARGHYAGIVLNDGTIFISGGATLPAGINADIYNPTTQTFSATGNFTMVQTGAREALAPDGTVLLASGVNNAVPAVTVPNSELFYPAPLAPGIVITTPTVLPSASQNQAFTQVLLEHGGVGQLTWHSTSLPAGLALSASGILTGSPTGSGTYTIPVTLADSSVPPQTASTSFTLNVAAAVPTLAITTITLPNGTVGTPYTATINTSGGTAPIFFSVTQASFPPGLAITQPATGSTSDTLAGTPITPGTYNFFEQVSDSGNPQQTAQQNYSVTISPAAPPPAVLAFTQEPGNETTNQVIPTFVAQLMQGGAPVVGATVSLTFANATCSSASLSGNPSVTTDSNGNATFNNVFVDRGGLGYTLTATSTSPSATATSTAFNAPGFCATTPLHTPRDGHVGVLFPNGLVLLVGGFNTVTSAYVTSAEIYTPGSGFAVTAGSLTTGRTNHTATLLTTGPNAGSVLIAGGTIDSANDGTATTELFNPSTGNFTPGPTMSTVRYNHTATLLANGDVLIAGGSSSVQVSGDLNTAEIYHAATGTFSLPINMTAVHAGPTATLLPNGQVLIAGGFMFIPSGGGFISVPTTVAELFDPATNQFTATGSTHTARGEDFAVLLPNGKVLVGGGTNASNTLDGTAEIYDPNTGVFTFTGSLTPTINASATVLPTGKVLVTGGFNGSSPETSQAQLFDPAAGPGTFTIIPPMVDGRRFFPLTVLNDGTTLVPGGFTSGGSFVNSELYFPDASAGMQVTSPHTLPVALVGTPYTQILEEQGGVGPLTWTLLANPPGFSLSPSGVLTGTGTTSNTYDVPVQLTDSSTPPQTASTTLNLPVLDPVTITTTSLPGSGTDNGSPAINYSAQIQTSGGAGGATTFSIVSGALPSSITLNLSTGQLISSAVNNLTGTYNFTVKAVSAGPPSSSSTQALSITLYPFFTAGTPNILTSGTVGTPYSTNISSSGGVPPYTYSLAFGNTPPPGLTLTTGSPSATLSGTPTAMETPPYTFNVQASDSSVPPQGYVEQFTITIGAAGPGPIANLAFTNQPAQSIDDGPIVGQAGTTTSVQVKATDASNIPVPNATLTIAFGNMPCGSAQLEINPPPTAVTDGTGTATFSSLRTFTSGANGYTLVASATTGATATSTSYNVTGYCSVGTPHAAHSNGRAVGLNNSKVLVVGGQDSTSGAPIVNTAELYDQTTQTFTLTGAMNVPRTDFTATLLNDGTVLVAGGESQVTPPVGIEATAEIYDPTTGVFTVVGNMNGARFAHTAVLLPGGMVLISGGRNSGGFLNTNELYDPINKVFLNTDGLLNTARADATATLIPGAHPMVLIAGGVGGAASTAPGLNTAELYDPSVGSFTLTAQPMTTAHTGHTATLLTTTDNTVLIVGGQLGSGAGSTVAEIYDPVADTFTATTGPLNVGRSFHSAIKLTTGKVLISGGWTNFGNASTNQAEIFDPLASTFSKQGLLAFSRSLAGVAPLPSALTLVVGGTESGSIGSVPAEVYNPGP